MELTTGAILRRITETSLSVSAHKPVSYTHLTLPTICSV